MSAKLQVCAIRRIITWTLKSRINPKKNLNDYLYPQRLVIDVYFFNLGVNSVYVAVNDLH